MIFYKKFTLILCSTLILTGFYYDNLVYSNYIAHFEIPLHQKQVKKLAIIGAGAGGSSASYWLKEAFTNSSLNVNTTVYEQSSIVGGRAKTIKFEYNGEKFNIELGATLFIDDNYNMFNSAKKFGLEFIKPGEEVPDARFGIWTGEKFIFEESSHSYWNLIKIIWKYGIAPFKVKSLVRETIKAFLGIYEFEKPFTSIESAAKRLNIHSLQTLTGDYYFSEIKKINKNYIYDFIEPAVRANYGQNISDIHAIGTFISLAPQGAKGIKGGNFLLFEKFIENSGANLQLNSKVIKIKKLPEKSSIDTIDSSKYLVYTKSGTIEEYDGIILATPISFDDLPLQILTTNGPKVDFLVLGTRKRLDNGETINKFFTRNHLSDEVLNKIYLNKSWIYRKVWKSYPKLLPNQTFPPLEIDENFFYVNSTGILNDRRVVNIGASNKCFEVINNKKFPFGAGETGNPLEPFITLAANDLKTGTKIYLKEFDGLRLPINNKIHNGCFKIGDTGFSLGKNHIDVFVLKEKFYEKIDAKINRERINVVTKDCKLLNYGPFK
ncbi:1680_t:CDS:2 [Entrophospora sp. SA101]|nr:1680_t:CDS:2 [Entrophospora sp. SA101]